MAYDFDPDAAPLAAAMTRSGHRPAIACTDDGPRDHHAVLLLHSLGADGGMWADQVESLRATHRVVVPDARGHGGSGWTGQATLDEWTADLRHTMDELGLRRIAIVGISMGGIQALAFALEHPDLVSALVLADTFAELEPALADEKIRNMTSRSRSLGMAAFADAYVAETFVVPGAHPRVELIRAPLARMTLDAYEVSARTCFGARLADQLGQIDAPTLVLWGDHDVKTPRALSETLSRGLPNATLAEIPNAGHLSNLDNPSEFTRRVMTHVERIRART